MLYCRFVTALTEDRATGLWLYSIFEFQRGVGNIVGGVLSGIIVKGNVERSGYGMGRYQWLVLFVGAGMLISSIGGFGWYFRGRCFNFKCLFEKYSFGRRLRDNLGGK